MWQYHSVVKRKLKKAERGITKAVFTLTLWVTKQGLIISDKSTLVETCSKFISCQKTYGRCWKHLQPPMTGTACVPMASARATAWACLNPTEGGSISISQNKNNVASYKGISTRKWVWYAPSYHLTLGLCIIQVLWWATITICQIT